MDLEQLFHGNTQFERFKMVALEEEWRTEDMEEQAIQCVKAMVARNEDRYHRFRDSICLHIIRCWLVFCNNFDFEKCCMILFAAQRNANVSLLAIQCAIVTIVEYEEDGDYLDVRQ